MQDPNNYRLGNATLTVMRKIFFYTILASLFFLVIGALVFFFIKRSSPTGQTSTGGFFGFGSVVPVTQTSTDTTNTAQTGDSTLQKVFKIVDGPVAGATFIQTVNPTTTVVRYTRADNGHVLDMPLDVPGAVGQPVSNVTIPGINTSVWTTNGSSTIMQYSDSGTLKSVFMEFAPTTATSSSATPLRVRFLPNNILSFALSPTNTRIAYLVLNSNNGADGYVSNIDGTNTKFLFSLPLSQLLLSWPSTGTLLVQTKSAVNVPGIAYSVNANTGTLSPLLYTAGLSVSANTTFTKVLYQTSSDARAITYSHDIATGKDARLASTPLPEKCTWSRALLTDIYCAVPLDTVSPNYLDLWHKGLIQAADSIVDLDTNTGIGTVITLPGDGGATAEIEQLMLSPDEHYLMFITRGDQSLWGVRLQ